MPGLILPPAFAIHGERPATHCTLCGHPFFEREIGPGGAFERHVMSHPIEDMHPHSLHTQAPGLFDSNSEASGDVEWGQYIRRMNEERPEGWRRWMRTSLDQG
jgi:hypothetical protein